MKIVISGGLGYVGGRLSKYLAEQGHEVTALSRQAGALPGITFPDNLKIVHPDTMLSDVTKLKGTDAFIHLAALNENDCVKYPNKAIEVNITQTVQWLDIAQQAGVGKFIYFSTAHVYGKPLQGFYDESSLATPVHPYAITHRCAEDYVLAYAAEKKISSLVVRLTNSFGGPAFPTADRWTLLVNDLCRSAVTGRAMALVSDGLQLRDFVCLSDVCRAVFHLLKRDITGTENIYNLGYGESISVWDMALKVQQVAQDHFGEAVAISRKALPAVVKKDSLEISINKLKNTGFMPVNAMEEEILSTLQYFEQHDVTETR